MTKSAPYSVLVVVAILSAIFALLPWLGVEAFASLPLSSFPSSILSVSSSSSSSFSPRIRPSVSCLLASTDDDSISGNHDDDENSTGAATTTTKKRLAILLCPAQFCVPVDYTKLLDTIQNSLSSSSSSSSQHIVEVVATCVAPLPRTEWIKVAKQLPTKNFIDANLSVKVTLDWYFEAMERGLSELMVETGGMADDIEICVIGHSIGGWIARAYLGGLSGYVCVHREILCCYDFKVSYLS